jgi:hypothetical protein
VLEDAEGGIERSLWLSERDLLLLSEDMDMVSLGLDGRPPSIGGPCEPIGVAIDNFGAPAFAARLKRGMSPGFSASGPTGLWFGEGGMARPNLRPPAPLPRPPG